MRKPPPIALMTAAFCGGLTALTLLGGRSLAVYFGGIVALAVCVPIGAGMARTLRELVWISLLCAATVVLLWLVSETTRWMPCAGIAVAFATGLSGLTALLSHSPGTPGEGWGEGDLDRRTVTAIPNHPHPNPLPEYRERGQATFASTVVIVLALAWLSWPIWLSPALGGHQAQALVDWLVPAHPLLALNAQLLHLGVWTERPMMYRWTILNQDVSYEMPTNPLWCIIVHLMMGIPGFLRIGMRK